MYILKYHIKEWISQCKDEADINESLWCLFKAFHLLYKAPKGLLFALQITLILGTCQKNFVIYSK